MPHAFHKMNTPIKTLTSGSSQFQLVKAMMTPAMTAPSVDSTSPIKCKNVLRRLRSWSLPLLTSRAVPRLIAVVVLLFPLFNYARGHLIRHSARDLEQSVGGLLKMPFMKSWGRRDVAAREENIGRRAA